MMQFQKGKRMLSVLLCVLLLLSVAMIPAAAVDASKAFGELKNPTGKLLAVSKYGNVREYPEQSVEAILSAAEQGADMIYVRVRKTSDNYIVLSADENLSRMCVDSLGNVVNKNISEIGYHELSTYHLRQGTGSLHEVITKSTVPTLEEVLTKLDGKALLLIDGAWEFRDEVYTLLSEKNFLNAAVLISSGDRKETVTWLSSKTTMPLVVSSYHGNVVFSARNMVSKTLAGGAVGTLLSTGNAYGVNFKDSVMKKFPENGRAFIDMTDPDLCGKRKDTPEGWNDVTARGYNVIITNNIPELLEYFGRVEKQKERLSANIEAAQKIDVTLCSTSSANSLKDAITNSKNVLQTPTSENVLIESNYQLQTALDGLTNRTGDAEGKTVTTGRIVAVVLVVIALLIFAFVMEMVRRQKMQKRKKALREKRLREERNRQTEDK